MADDLEEFMKESMYVDVPINIPIEEIAHLKRFLVAIQNECPNPSILWRNMLGEIKRITGHDEYGNPLQSVFWCECGAQLISKPGRHQEDIFCDVCGRHYLVAYFDGVAHHVREEVPK